MKILMLTPYLPYPDSSGGQIRTQNLLKHLKKDHDITLLSLIKDPKEEEYIPILEKKFCHKVRVFRRSQKPFTLKNIFKTAFSLYPFLVVRNFSDDLRKALAEELKTNHYDLIHVETFYAMPHLPATNIPIVLVDQTIEFKVYLHHVQHSGSLLLKPAMYLDVLKLKYWERYYWRQANRVIAVSHADKQEMLLLEPDLKVDIVPNGVNLDFFKAKSSWKSNIPTLLFVSNFNWLQNTEAAEVLIKEVFPLVKAKLHQAKVWIVGQHLPSRLLEMRSGDIDITEVAENDPDTIKKAYYQADIFVTPLKGPGGTRLKNLAAMASCLPIVSSTVGMSGLGIKNGVHAVIADTPQDLADAIVDLINYPAKAAKIANSARLFVEKYYDYASIASGLSSIYRQVAKKE